MSDRSSEQGREEPRTRTFNPKEHVVQLKSKQGSQDYLPVQWRLVWFREQCPHGTIDTEEVEVDLDREMEVEAFVWNNEKRRSEKVMKHAKGYARFRAIVTDGKGGRATGTKSECAANFPDFIEKAETGSIGRALAALGYGTQFAPELDEQHRIVDAPVERGTAPTGYEHSNGNGSVPAAVMRPSIVNGNGSNGNSIHANGPGTSEEASVDGVATEQQVSSIRKLCERLGKSEPENVASISNLAARKLIQQLTAEYREQRQQSTKAS